MKTTDKLAWNSQKLWDLTAFLTVNDHPAVEDVFCLTNSHTANIYIYFDEAARYTRLKRMKNCTVKPPL